LRGLIQDLTKLVDQHPDAGEVMVCTVHSSSGATDHLNSFRIKPLTEYDLKNDFGFFYEDEGLVVGDKVIVLSVGGN
jgi:hypothetical protein